MNTERSQSQSFVLIKSNWRDCPKKIKKCKVCWFEFNCANKYVVKTAGVQEHTGTSGRLVRETGNAYLHFLTAFLLKFDTNIQKGTQKILTV